MINKLNIIDVETTGVSKTDNVIELAQAIIDIPLNDFRDLSLLDIENNIEIKCERFKPDVRINPHAHAVHGITTLDLLHCKHHSLIDIDNADLYIFHNAPFDTRMISSSNKDISFKKDEVFCTMDFAKRWIKQSNKGLSAKLDDLLMHFVDDVNKDIIVKKHDAKTDVLKTVVVLQGLVNEYKGLKDWTDVQNFYLTLKSIK